MTGTLARVEKKNPFSIIIDFFKGVVIDLVEGDIFVKLSLLIMGAGYFRRKQIVKGIIMMLFQVVIIFFAFTFAAHYLSRFGTLGTVELERVFNPATMRNEFNDYDHSFQILLYGVVSIIVLTAAAFIYLRNIRNVRALEIKARNGERLPTFAEDVMSLKNERFHITILSLPCLGIVLFTIVPLIIMISVAFTNYDQVNMPPASLFTWVGLENFRTLFTNTAASSFGYAFGIVLSWTLIWAFAATFSNFFLGILLASFINSTKTKLKRMWRTLFIVTIAVPQFVTLLVVRNFFSQIGIANNIAKEWGITAFLSNLGLIPAHQDFIPFLTDPIWARVMIILINIWIGVPFMMLIATGVLMNIPKDLYESARIDGASPFKQFVYITMPYMLFVTAPFLVTQVVHNINNFNVIFLLTQDVYRTTDQMLANAGAREIDLLVTWLYRLTQEQYDYKMASVIGIMVFVVCAVFTLIAFNLVLGRNKEDKFQL
jgi:arabinogalactan oligomer/maltooligosaccharide transport system permease protein